MWVITIEYILTRLPTYDIILSLISLFDRGLPFGFLLVTREDVLYLFEIQSVHLLDLLLLKRFHAHQLLVKFGLSHDDFLKF